MTMQLRPIQQQAIDATLAAFKKGETYNLLVAPMAFGKTTFSSFLMSLAFKQFKARSLFLAHLTELVEQTAAEMYRVDSSLDFGVICGTLKSKVVADVTVGTRQSVSGNLEMIGVINLLIIDEVHLFSEQYQQIVNHFLALNPRLRVLGLTGTPYSLKEGWIYGEGKRWSEPVFETTIDAMIESGYLCRYKYKVAEDMSKDLDNVKLVAGEFHEGELSEVMELHMGSVKKIIDEHCKKRKSILVFAVSIAHAEKLAKFLGVNCVHSKLNRDTWRDRVDRFKNGDDRVLVNVSQLSVGFNAPTIDAVIMSRPTMSPALMFQCIGRGLRIAENKMDCLIIDMVGNYARHGLPNNPKIRAPKEEQDPREKKLKESSVCPGCFDVVDGLAIICPNCGAELKEKKKIIELNEEMRLQEIETERKRPKFLRWWVKPDHITKQGNSGVLYFAQTTARSKPLMRFAGYDTEKQKRIFSQLSNINEGDNVELITTAYGLWIK